MTASDCFQLGTEFYKSGETLYAIMWLKEALKRFDVGTDEDQLEDNIKVYLSHVHYEKGNSKWIRTFQLKIDRTGG